MKMGVIEACLVDEGAFAALPHCFDQIDRGVFSVHLQFERALFESFSISFELIWRRELKTEALVKQVVFGCQRQQKCSGVVRNMSNISRDGKAGVREPNLARISMFTILERMPNGHHTCLGSQGCRRIWLCEQKKVPENRSGNDENG